MESNPTAPAVKSRGRRPRFSYMCAIPQLEAGGAEGHKETLHAVRNIPKPLFLLHISTFLSFPVPSPGSVSRSLHLISISKLWSFFRPFLESWKPSILWSVSQSVQSLSRVRLFTTPRITACHASLSISNFRSSLKLTSIESVMPSSHLILCCPLLLLPQIPPSIRVFFWYISAIPVLAISADRQGEKSDGS